MDGYAGTGEDRLSLAEFIALPTTVDIQALYTDALAAYADARPYIRVGARLANDYTVLYLNSRYLDRTVAELGGDPFGYYPKILSPLDSRANDAAGITPLVEAPFPGLTGRGVVVGIVDTGVDYTLPCFAFPDGRTRMIGLWDQTVDGPRRAGLNFGSSYGRSEIDRALASPDPRAVVPSFDEDGHGTFLASVAAGSRAAGLPVGAAPEAYIAAVTLRRARPFYIDRYLLSPDEPALFESTDCLLGIRYILDVARENGLPAVICLGLGSSFCAHDGNTLFEDYISFVSERAGYAFVTAAGNEANTRRHTRGRVAPDGSDAVEIRVAYEGSSFTVAAFTAAFDSLSVAVSSPTGVVLPRTPLRGAMDLTRSSPFEGGAVRLRFDRGANNNIVVGIANAAAGIWEITLFGDSVVDGVYNAWLPVAGQAPEGVEFLRPVPESTAVYPATALRTITCGAYDSRSESLFAASSWGPTLLPRVAPDLVAPGVAVAGVFPYGPGTMTGTSAAAAVTSGAVALLLEYAVARGNIPALNGDAARSILISGARRDGALTYPNNKWGFGKLDLYNSFKKLS